MLKPDTLRSRIYLSDADGTLIRSYVEELALELAGATVYYTDGYWQGAKEFGAVVELIGLPRAVVDHLAAEAKRALEQDAVLVTHELVTSELI